MAFIEVRNVFELPFPNVLSEKKKAVPIWRWFRKRGCTGSDCCGDARLGERFGKDYRGINRLVGHVIVKHSRNKKV